MLRRLLTAVAEVALQRRTLQLSPAEMAGLAFWLGLPWSMKMVAGVASDVYPIGRLMITVGLVGLLPLVALPLLWREAQTRSPRTPGNAEASA